MYLVLYRKHHEGEAVHGRLYLRTSTMDEEGVLHMEETLICNTLERFGYLIPPLIYRVQVTMSAKFGRLMPEVLGVPRTTKTQTKTTTTTGERLGIRVHRGTKPEHSKGCILVPSREIEDYLTDMLLRAQQDGEEIRIEINTPIY